ncbi:alpha/beta hydrolase [Glaciihabitans sp. GrIS 2.15]|uniref:alpha/beta hydrolase n=1 Tax=Glaciihabitans sp. GrIS 2.15 TaxID=3071710 RepID=UPI002DFB848C|nr:enterochelin esterase-like enzyme [Glaciihabitans sp. GrIS 2.15]
MSHQLFDLRLETGPFPIIVYALAAVILVVLATRRPVRRWLPIQLLGALAGAGVGLILAWLVSDVWNSFGVALTLITRMWFALGVGGIGFAIAGLWRARAWRVVVGSASVIIFAFAGAIGVNVDVAEFPTLGSALGVNAIGKLALPAAQSTPTSTIPESLAQSWHAPADLPKVGTVGYVTIPGTVSHFAARSAVVYLPPAALVAGAPRLPMLELLSGQPGGPSNLITSGAMASILDRFAAAHRGLAPIVVVPDQLGSPQLNPMCVDSVLGNSATYLTVDVTNWITHHLHVLPSGANWAIGGFSQGGTCSIQLGTKYRGLFGSILDIAGELAPHHGSIPATIASAFGGSAAQYHAATPLSLLASGAPWTDTLGIFVIGQNDARFGVASSAVSKAAEAAGMTMHHLVSPGTAHDWKTVQFGIRTAMPLLGDRWGL